MPPPSDVASRQPLGFATVPRRVIDALQGLEPGSAPTDARTLERLGTVRPRDPDREGGTETIDGVSFTHRFVDVPGDGGLVTYHLVETGPPDGEPVLLLHGVPNSWYAWHHVMSALAGRYRLIAPDLKGYGQSDKRPGDYSYAGTAQELVGLVDALGIGRFNLVGHDRGTACADHIAAAHPFRVMRYVRGEQHLVEYHPMLSPQERFFARSEPMRDPVGLVGSLLAPAGAARPVSDPDLLRSIQEYGFPGIADAVPRYFNGSTFVAEWIERRTRLMSAWRAPVLLLQGLHSTLQPHEFYVADDVRPHLPNALGVDVAMIDAGHFWPLENPAATVEAIRTFLRDAPAFDARAWLAGLALEA